MTAKRLNDGAPIITARDFTDAGASPREGANINGPSVIRVPDWVPRHERPAEDADYYLYFAHHQGHYIRMAFAPNPVGPWRLFNVGGSTPSASLGDPDHGIAPRKTPGRVVVDLALGGSRTFSAGSFKGRGHIASPDVVVDHANRRLIMYLHAPGPGDQQTFVTTSRFGLNFNNPAPDDASRRGHGFRDVIPGYFYFRTFEVDGRTFAFANMGKLYRAPAMTDAGEPATLANADAPGGLFNPGDGERLGYWEVIDDAANPIRRLYRDELGRPPTGKRHGGLWDPRHFTILPDPPEAPDRLLVFYSASNDRPERILLTVLDLSGLSLDKRSDPANWRIMKPAQQTILAPEMPWEGADLPLKPSGKGTATGVRELRDPFVFRDRDGALYLYYTGEGEAAIGVAALQIDTDSSTTTNRIP